MLALLAAYPHAIERDLRRVGIRYSDRWRRGPDGTRLLTLREIWVQIEELPHDSSLVRATNKGAARWSTTDYLIADLWRAWTGKPHPSRPAQTVHKQAAMRHDKATRKTLQRFAARNRAMAASTRKGVAGD